jgi:integrase
MARQINRLTEAQVAKAAPGMHGDGLGLWLRVSTTGNRSWAFRYMQFGKPHEHGLGPTHARNLAAARKKAAECRRNLLDGIDPIQDKHARHEKKRLELAKLVTFADCATRFIAAKRAGWRSAKHARDFATSLETYAYPTLGKLPVSAIEIGHITKILEPIWNTKRETASRTRGRIEMILDYGTVHGWRKGENPARWSGNLEHVLSGGKHVVKPHKALDWREIGPFMADLSNAQGIVGALPLRFAILTASRTSEALKAKWSEIDLQAKTWIIPGSRMKAALEHRVPLSTEAMAVLQEAAQLRLDSSPDTFIFPGIKSPNKPLSESTLLDTVRAMGRRATGHGFRSCFRTWAAETGKPEDIAEASIAHKLGGKVQQAYQRGDLLNRRRKLMQQWAGYCTTIPSDADNVVSLHGGDAVSAVS